MKFKLRSKDDGRGWPGYLLGRIRTSTAALIIAFVALFWLHEALQPEPAATETPPTQVVPPGFVPDPNYTWVPRTNVRRPREPVVTTTPTTTTETTTTSPGETTTSPTSPTESTPLMPAPTNSPTPTPTATTPPGAGLGPAAITPAPPR